MLGQGQGQAVEGLQGLVDLLGVVGLLRQAAQVRHPLGYLAADVGVQRLAGPVQGLFGLVGVEGHLVADVDQAVDLEVLHRVGVGVALHVADLVAGQPVRGDHLDARLLAAALLLRRNVQDAVLVDQECYLHLGAASRHRGDASQLELAEAAAVLRQFPLALQHRQLDARLAVDERREHLGRLAGHAGVPQNQLGDRPAERLNAQAQRHHVQQQDLALGPAHDRCLHGCAQGDHLVRVQGGVRLGAEDLRQPAADVGHPRRAADEHDLVDLFGRQVRVAQRLAARVDRPLDVRFDHCLELLAGQLHAEAPPLAQVDFERHLLLVAQADLDRLCQVPQALQGARREAEVLAVALADLDLHQPDDLPVEVVAAQVGVAVGAEDLERPAAQPQDRHVEGPPAQVVHGDGRFLAAVEPVGQRRGGRLVDDPHDLEPGDPAGVARRLALGVVEVGGHSDDRLADGPLEIRLGTGLQVAQDERRDFRGRIDPFADPHGRQVATLLARPADHRIRQPLRLFLHVLEAASHQPLDGVDRDLGPLDRVQPGAGSNVGTAADRIDRHDRRHHAGVGLALAVETYDPRPPLVGECHKRVGRAQVDPDNRFGRGVRHGAYHRVGRAMPANQVV